jgi:hypothetical protein
MIRSINYYATNVPFYISSTPKQPIAFNKLDITNCVCNKDSSDIMEMFDNSSSELCIEYNNSFSYYLTCIKNIYNNLIQKLLIK